MKSMTAYGRKSITTSHGGLVLEIHSVNGKGLTVALKAPPEFLPFDIDIRKWVGKRVRRGSVTVRISREGSRDEATKALGTLKTQWERVAQQLGYSKEAITLRFLADELRHSPQEGIDNALRKELEKGIASALDPFVEMREAEGKALLSDMSARLEKIEAACSGIDKVTGTVERYRERLSGKLRELGIEDEERIAKEVVLFAERIDISEEVTRLRSHIEQFRTYFKSDEQVGRTLEFLLQEMHREANTISAKSQELGIAKLSIEIKSELGKLKEQVANIE